MWFTGYLRRLLVSYTYLGRYICLSEYMMSIVDSMISLLP